MNRIDNMLAHLRSIKKKMLSPYLTAGDPNPELTVPLMHALVEAGANLLEIGLPFSDPMAEGPVIQAAMERALANGVGCEQVFSMVEEFRKTDLQTPIVLMGYLNPIEQYGYERFAKRAKSAGIDGTIIVDLPPEESEFLAAIWQASQLHSIYLCSPTTSERRMALINHFGRGYLYYVSLKGVTGSDDFDLENVKLHYQQRKSQTDLPLMVGFGIKTAVTAAEVAKFADGVIVGAALIKQIYEAYNTGHNVIAAGASLIQAMRQEMDKNE
ncbi:tryptophan synthase subunit alpha [Legionella jordanis]|uniref:Tryptophan synthase alpha chain n=1 Tax=Legionella jordanis TaxID=456 RepID=A0A0W0V991_9GAMM|nr:tryptophan synthase subunit alpha [Legionella jordanis]KTD16201.1 tryptophan synthase subunit alpha [Legionella jordanis]RMX04578.1 tryptophan synthase subunit alpha [Legionella jordanis]RMX21124.1 tryptophan synthase subunit alpha [Legionella jordanis]VEH12341.1 tryptophan synthase subunit alpha [Legionella jordanis]HAT8713548.1 tryptophan synthase subunit alpha [Legionella jordanis]